jgi:hypothetical protein
LDLRNVNWDEVNASLNLVPWNTCLANFTTAEEALGRWINLLHTTLHALIPMKRIKTSARDKSWFTPYIKHLIVLIYAVEHLKM